jgi:hypothetical protein
VALLPLHPICADTSRAREVRSEEALDALGIVDPGLQAAHRAELGGHVLPELRRCDIRGRELSGDRKQLDELRPLQ